MPKLDRDEEGNNPCQTDKLVCLLDLMKRIRDKILETAGDLFQQRGYTGVGINEIIQTAEVSKAGFYQNFESKENLCIQWLRETHTRSLRRHQDILEADRPSQEKIKNYFDSLADFMKCRNFRGCPFSNTASVIDAESQRIHTEIESHKIFIREFFIDLATGCRSTTDADSLGSHLFLLYSGAATEAQNLRTDWPIKTASKIAIQLADSTSSPEMEGVRRKRDLLAV